MDQLGEQLLAAAARAVDEHDRVGGGHALRGLEGFFERLAASDDLLAISETAPELQGNDSASTMSLIEAQAPELPVYSELMFLGIEPPPEANADEFLELVANSEYQISKRLFAGHKNPFTG